MADNNSLISVVVPVYNAEKYISDCINSILAQTYKNIECVVVDDGSNDLSGSICDDFVEKDRRVRVIHQANGGVVAARAVGVRVSKGEYISFVDADDTLAPEALENMSDGMDVSTDVVVSESKDNRDCTKEDYLKLLFSFRSWMIWGKLYRKSLFNDYVLSVPSFFCVGEDFLTQLRLLTMLKGGVKLLNIKNYNYNTRNLGSVQLAHRSSYEYERKMIEEVEKIIERLSYKEIDLAFFQWRMAYLCGMIGLQYKIDFEDEWIKRLQNDSKRHTLSVREELTLKAIYNPLLKLPFFFEKQLKNFARYIRFKMRLLKLW